MLQSLISFEQVLNQSSYNNLRITRREGNMRSRLIGLLAILAFLAVKAHAAASLGARAICDSFEKAEVDHLFSKCKQQDLQDPSLAAQLEAANRAAGQCRELLSASISLRHVKTNPSLAQKCLEARTAWAADSARSQAKAQAMRTVCDQAIVGLRVDGQSCDSAFECVPGLVCVGERGAPPGTCRKPLALNAACDDDTMNASQLHALMLAVRNVCGPGAHCGSKDGNLVCRPNLAPGQDCDGKSRYACGPSGRCNAGRCVAETRGGSGSSCKQSDDCSDSFYCSPRQRCELRLSAGARCSLEHECKGICRSGTCQARCGSG